MDFFSSALIQAFSEQQSKMLEQLHQFCTINSGSKNLAGLAETLETLRLAFRPLADRIEVLSSLPINTINEKGEMDSLLCGNSLFIQKRPELKRRILLCGHMDTVYGVNHSFQSLTYINENQLNGPGVADMKGGLVVLLHALRHFEETAAAKKLGWDILINSDEELGSPSSSLLFPEIAQNYQAALVYEPALDKEGTLAKNRRGSGKLTLIAKGKEAHVGRAFSQGRNAICYLAEAITHIHALNNNQRGLTINIGFIAGGEALNMVPDKAIAKLDVRTNTPEDEAWVIQQINLIIQSMEREGFSLKLEGHFGRPVKRVCRSTERLFQRIRNAGQSLGLKINWQDSGGCCDGNNLAALGLPVIDTLGVRGGAIHSPLEFLLIDSLVERAALSTLVLLDLAQGGLEELRT